MIGRNSKATDVSSQSVRDAQIRFLHQVPLRILVNAINAVIVAAVLWNSISHTLLLSWVVATSAIAAIRYGLSKHYNRNPPSSDVDKAARRYAAGSMASGLLWGMAAAVMWLTPDMFLQVFVAFVVGGMCAAIAATNSYHLPTVHTFSLTASAPWIVGLIIKGEHSYIALAAMWIIFLLFLTVYARVANTILLKSLRLQEENSALVDDLSRSHETLEERVRERTSELESINLALQEEMQAHAETERHLRQAQKMEATGQLTGGIAHDFNNLLAIIQGNAELLTDEAYANKPMAQAILRATDRGAELTQRLLAFSRLQPLQPQPIDMSELIEEMSDLLTRALGETIEIEFDSAPDLWTALADRGQVENALLNLAINARDAMPNGGKLAVGCANVNIDTTDIAASPEAAAGDYIVLTVTDTGHGISEEVLEHVFEPFFTTKDVGKGSGLGLSMVHGFAKQSGGHVEIRSTVGVGTTVALYLPRSGSAVRKRGSESETSAPSGSNETVLVVEDDPEVRKMTVRMLTDLGYRVLGTGDAAGARKILDRETRIDLLLSDVVLPGGQSGPDFAIEAANRISDLKVVLMSGYPSTLDGSALSTEQVLLKKPFRKRQLAEAIHDTLRQGK